MAFTIIDATGPVIGAKISGELSKPEVIQMQTAALKAIQRHGKIRGLFILENFQGWKKEVISTRLAVGTIVLHALYWPKVQYKPLQRSDN